MKHPSLANAELAVMKLLWGEDGFSARAIREQLWFISSQPRSADKSMRAVKWNHSPPS